MSIKITGFNTELIKRLQEKLDKFDASRQAEQARLKELNEMRTRNVQLADTPAHEESYQTVLGEYKKAVGILKADAEKARKTTDYDHIHKYFRRRRYLKINQILSAGSKDHSHIHLHYKEYLEELHKFAQKITDTDFETPITEAQNASQLRKRLAQAEIESSQIYQTFPSSRDKLHQENPAEYLRQAAIYQLKLLDKKDGTAALAFGTAWIRNLPKGTTWEQVENMSLMMLEAAQISENADFIEFRTAVVQWSKEHPPSESPDPAHVTPAHAATPWGRRTYILGRLYLSGQNLDLSPEAFQLYKNCSSLLPDNPSWKIARAFYHISKLECAEAEQLLTDLPKDDPLVIQAQKCLKEAKTEKEFSLIDTSRDKLLQENPAEYLRQAALYQDKLLKRKDAIAAVAFGTAWIKNLPKEATWEQVDAMSMMMLEAAKQTSNIDLTEYRAIVSQWVKEHPLPENPDSSPLTPAQAETPLGRRTLVLGLLFSTTKLDLSLEAFQVYKNCSSLYPNESVWQIVQAYYHISNLQWVEAKQLLADLPKDDVSVREVQKYLTDNYKERVCSAVLDLGSIALSRLIPSSYTETLKFDIGNTIFQLFSNSSVRRLWFPYVLGTSEPSVTSSHSRTFRPSLSIRQFIFSSYFTMAADVVDFVFRNTRSLSHLKKAETFVSYGMRIGPVAWTVGSNPEQRSVPSFLYLGSSCISVIQSIDACRMPAPYQACLSTVQKIMSDVSATFAVAHYADLLHLIGIRPPSLATRKSINPFVAAAGIGALAAGYRIYADYPYLWAACVMQEAELYYSQGKYEDANTVLTAAKSSWFVSRTRPAVDKYTDYGNWLNGNRNYLENPDQYEEFLIQLNPVLLALKAVSHYEGVRNSLLLKKVEVAIRKQDSVKLREVLEEDSSSKILDISHNILLRHSYHLVLRDPAAAGTLLQTMGSLFPERFHPISRALLPLLPAQSSTRTSLREWPQLNLLILLQNRPSLNEVTKWNNELQKLQDFFEKHLGKTGVYQHLQYYKLMVSFSQTDKDEQTRVLFSESDVDIHQRFAHEVISSIRLLRGVGNHPLAIDTLGRVVQITSFRYRSLIENYGRFFSSLYAPTSQRGEVSEQLETCVAGLDLKDDFHQEVHVFLESCRIVLKIDAGEYAAVEPLLTQEHTDLRVSTEVAALLFERIYFSSVQNRVGEAITELDILIANLGSWQHLELFRAFQSYLTCDHSLDADVQHLTSVLTQLERFEQLSGIAFNLRSLRDFHQTQRDYDQFVLFLTQERFIEARTFLAASRSSSPEIYSELCKTVSLFLIHRGERWRHQNIPPRRVARDLQGELDESFGIPSSDIISSYFNFLSHLQIIEDNGGDFTALQNARQSLDNVIEKFQAIQRPIPESLHLERRNISLAIGELAMHTNQPRIALREFESIDIAGIHISQRPQLDRNIKTLRAQLNEH